MKALRDHLRIHEIALTAPSTLPQRHIDGGAEEVDGDGVGGSVPVQDDEEQLRGLDTTAAVSNTSPTPHLGHALQHEHADRQVQLRRGALHTVIQYLPDI